MVANNPVWVGRRPESPRGSALVELKHAEARGLRFGNWVLCFVSFPGWDTAEAYKRAPRPFPLVEGRGLVGGEGGGRGGGGRGAGPHQNSHGNAKCSSS